MYLLKMKMAYWHRFEEGCLQPDAYITLLDATNKALDYCEFPIDDWSKIKHIFEVKPEQSWYETLPIIKNFYKDALLINL